MDVNIKFLLYLNFPGKYAILIEISLMEGAVVMKIQESAENYLETILIIGNRKPQVRSIDIANELDFSKPSVSVAMKNLRLNGYIQMDHD